MSTETGVERLVAPASLDAGEDSNTRTLKAAVTFHRWNFFWVFVAGSVTACFQFAFPQTDRVVVEQDVTISFPYVEHETIPNALLLVLSIATPMIIVLVIQVIVRCKYEGNDPQNEYIFDYLLFLTALLESALVANSITTFLKNFVARPRPNFFAYCDYKGYRAVAEALYTHPGEPSTNSLLDGYLNQTQPGVFANYDINCRLNSNEMRRSFPSGHACNSFAGLGVLAIYLFGLCRSVGASPALSALVAAAPFSLATFIAASRIYDYYHFQDDVLAGTVIGFSSAVFFSWLHYGGGSELRAKSGGSLSTRSSSY